MLFANLLITAFATVASVSASPVSKRDFGPITIFTPPSSYVNEKTLYARSLMLNDGKGTLLSTWENYDWSGMPVFPIYRSTDHGFTWAQISSAKDTQNGWGLRYQPILYQLPQAIGSFPAGTILLAGNSIPADLSKTQLDLYASKDNGLSWQFVSHIASGGVAKPNNGETPVWEPFLMVYNNQLIVYYSDQRDPKYGQKIVHQVTSDLKNWGAVVNDVAISDYNRRPGMPIVSKMGNGQYIMSYEDGNAPVSFAATVKIASDPTQFGSATAVVVKATDGYVPVGSPFNVVTTVGSSKGTVVLNAASSSDLFLNYNYGVGSWTRLSSQSPAGYSRSLAVGFNPKDILIVNGGQLGQGNTNKVTATARDVNGCSTCS